MRELWLMRHGHAVADARGGDELRPLSEDGTLDVATAGRALSRMGVKVDELWHSPFLRAQQTAQLVGAELGVSKRVESPDLTPSGAGRAVAERLFRADVRRLFVVSHLPLLPSVITELLGVTLSIDVTPATVVHLSLVNADRPSGAAVLSGLYRGAALATLGR